MKQLFFAKRSLFDRRVGPFYNELLANEELSAEQLAELNWRRCCEMVHHAYETIPFYRRKFSSIGFEPGDLKTRKDFDKLPILEKYQIRENTADMLSPNCRLSDLQESTTGGTTGAPLKVYHDAQIPLQVVSWRTLNWWGVSPADNSGYLYRAVPEGFKKILQKALLWPAKRNWIAAADMTADRMGAFYRALTHSETVYLVGYVGAVDAFASYLAKRGIKIESLKAVWTTSAPLTEGKRKLLEDILGCPVYTQYGSCEFYWIAAECRHQNGLHIASDIRQVDVVEGNQPVPVGEYGDLIITDLMNRKFPLIRYRLGDRGRIMDRRCSCKMPFPLIDYVKGRISDAIVMPSGDRIPGEFWTTIFDDYTDEVKSFQVHQAQDLSITVRYEPIRNADCSHLVAIVRTKLLDKLGPGAVLEFVQGAVDINDNGKTRFVVSEVKN